MHQCDRASSPFVVAGWYTQASAASVCFCLPGINIWGGNHGTSEAEHKGNWPTLPTHFRCLRGSRGGRVDISQDGPNGHRGQTDLLSERRLFTNSSRSLRVGIRGAFRRITDVLVSHGEPGQQIPVPARRKDGRTGGRAGRLPSGQMCFQCSPLPVGTFLLRLLWSQD